MAEAATRVALLARPGAACDNLQAALRQAGAEVVAVQDPTSGDPAAVSAARPGAVLVALEPAVEDALERYDALLSEPGRLVIYDEVAIAARREGWDAARWARHLAAKLGGHEDVLPPGAGHDEVAPAQRAGGDAMALEAMEFDADAVHLGIEASQEEALARAGSGIDFGGLTPEMMAALAGAPGAVAEEAEEAEAPAPTPAQEPSPADEAPHVLEWDVPAAPAPRDAPVHEGHEVHEAPAAPAAAPPAAPEPPPVRFSADELSLVDVEVPASPTQGTRNFLSLGADGDGGVVVLAGIGGPDAVRQLLSGLPGGFARPVLVRQRLDGGRHDRLVRQLQRATALPVELAEAGRTLAAGHVYILPDGMATQKGDDGAVRFAAADAPVPVLAGLDPSDSAVLLLSGSDPAVVPEVLEAARAGTLVVGQSPEDSFDGAAAEALLAAGGESRPAAELAQRLATRWLSLKD